VGGCAGALGAGEMPVWGIPEALHNFGINPAPPNPLSACGEGE